MCQFTETFPRQPRRDTAERHPKVVSDVYAPGSNEAMQLSALPTAFKFSTDRKVELLMQEERRQETLTPCSCGATCDG